MKQGGGIALLNDIFNMQKRLAKEFLLSRPSVDGTFHGTVGNAVFGNLP